MSDKARNKIIGSATPNVPGCQKFACAECNADVWLARSGQQIVRKQHAIPTCAKCALTAIAGPGGECEIEMPSRETILKDMGIIERN